MLWIVRLMLPVALLMLAGALAAQEPTRAPAQESTPAPAQAPPPRDLDPVVLTATKLETPASQLGASVTVVPGDDVQKYHYESVEDILRTVPGVEIRRSGSYGKVSNISVRGANANQVQVLVDGVRVKSPTTGQADLSDLSPDLIERIEVIRGPQSTLYGADAIGGVVNIITKKGKGAPLSGTIEGGAGNYDTYTGRGWFGGTYSLLDYSGSISHFESNGQFKNDSSDKNAVNLRLGVSLPWDSSIAFTLRWVRNETGLPVKFLNSPPFVLPNEPIIDSNNRQISETLVMALAGHTKPFDWWEIDARGGRYQNKTTFVDLPDAAEQCPFAPFGSCEFPGRFNVERWEAELVNHFHIGKWSTSSIGLEYRTEDGEAQGATPFDASSNTRSAFFQQTFRLWDRLFMSAGFRVEDNSVYGTHWTERGSLAYVIKEWGTKIRGGAGSGFRAPTFNDLFFPGFSDPTLKPETSFSWEVGVDQNLWKDRIRLGLTYFHNEFENLISLTFITTPPFVKGVNIGKARAEGIEFTSAVDILDNLTAWLNYTHTESENFQTHRLLPREPRDRLSLGLTWRPIPRLELFGDVQWVSKQFEPISGGAYVWNSGYTVVNAGATYRLFQRYAFIQGVDIWTRIQNLTNEDYSEVRGFPALGINALVGMRMTF
jgi:vitamin B12 transporter